jgi:hypothetical protein
MSDSCCLANSSDGTDGVECANSSRASLDPQHPTAIEHKVEEVVSLSQKHTHKHDSTGSRIRRRTTHTNPTNNSSGDLIGNRGAMNWGKLRGAVITLTVPEKKVENAPAVMQSVRSIVCATCQWFCFLTLNALLITVGDKDFNVLLVFIPLSVILCLQSHEHQPPLTRFSDSGPSILPSLIPTVIKTHWFSSVSRGGTL